MQRPIAISLSPNTEKQDVFGALKMLFLPWKYQQGKHISFLEQWFRRFFRVSFAVSFSSGRGAMYAALKTIGIKKGDEIITQAFTCVAVSDAIIAAEAKPVYADIDDSFTLDIKDVEKKITSKTKAIVAQHTFGIPSHMSELKVLAKKYFLLLIEDCAHTIGGTYENKKLGTFGDISFFSFGRDKAFSSVWGGMVITSNTMLGKKLRSFQQQKEYPSHAWITQQLLHPIAFAFILPLYNVFSLGKALLIFLQKLHILSFPVSKKEKEGFMEENTIKKLPNALAYLALLQVSKLTRFNKKRIEIARLYKEQFASTISYSESTDAIVFLRFPLLIEKRDDVLQVFRKKGMYLGNWYAGLIDPSGVAFERVYYKKGMCPKAEYVAKRIINLPTYPALKEKDAKKIAQQMEEYVQSRGN